MAASLRVLYFCLLLVCEEEGTRRGSVRRGEARAGAVVQILLSWYSDFYKARDFNRLLSDHLVLMEEELVREFAKNGFTIEDNDTAQQCLSLCSSFGMKASELMESWEVFYLNVQLENNKVQSSQIEKFRLFLQAQQRDAFRRQHGGVHIYTKDDVDMLLNDEEMDVENNVREVLVTPSKQPYSQDVIRGTPHAAVKTAADGSRQVFSPTTPFSQRTTKCSVQFTFNEHLTEDAPAVDPEATNEEESEGLVLRKLKAIRRCELEILGSGPKAGCRYMGDQLESRFNELEKRIKRFAKAFAEYESRPLSQHVAYAFQEQIMVVGRVCCDAEGHLNDKSVLLEGCVEYSGGHRVRLDLQELSQFSLFPGQVLAVEGHNPSGHCLVASRIFYSIPRPPYSSLSDGSPAAKRQATDQVAKLDLQSEASKPLSILVAGGPFTTSDNLAFEPLVELLSYCRKRRPNLLLLVGPFIDSEHPQIKQGIVDRLLAHVFQEEIRTRIEEYCEDLGEGARVVLVPSTRDAFHDRVFPQPPFDASIFEDPSGQITFLPNPGVFRLDEVVIGCCTTDILRHLSCEESSRIPAGVSSDRMTRLGAHIIGQRSFYPLFPPALGTRLDLSLDPTALDLPCTPDVLVLPSDLVAFVKPLNYTPGIKLEQSGNSEESSSLIVNPGRLAKGTMGGTFAEISVVAASSQSQVSDSLHGIPARTKLSFIRI